MNTSIAVGLALAIGAAIGADMMWNDMAGSLFLARKLTGLIDWMAFWR